VFKQVTVFHPCVCFQAYQAIRQPTSWSWTMRHGAKSITGLRCLMRFFSKCCVNRDSFSVSCARTEDVARCELCSKPAGCLGRRSRGSDRVFGNCSHRNMTPQGLGRRSCGGTVMYSDPRDDGRGELLISGGYGTHHTNLPISKAPLTCLLL
jgi:hypothetical protein